MVEIFKLQYRVIKVWTLNHSQANLDDILLRVVTVILRKADIARGIQRIEGGQGKHEFRGSQL